MSLTLRSWDDAMTHMRWYAFEECPGAKIGIPKMALVVADNPERVVRHALCALLDELRGQPGECVLTEGDVRALALLPEST